MKRQRLTRILILWGALQYVLHACTGNERYLVVAILAEVAALVLIGTDKHRNEKDKED